VDEGEGSSTWELERDVEFSKGTSVSGLQGSKPEEILRD